MKQPDLFSAVAVCEAKRGALEARKRARGCWGTKNGKLARRAFILAVARWLEMEWEVWG